MQKMEVEVVDPGGTVTVSKRVNVKTGKGKVMGVVREHYLRSDVPCGSVLCFEGCANGTRGAGGVLPTDVTHYLLPLEDVVRGYLEVLESPELRGLIYLQSVVGPVQVASQRHYRKICAQVRDPARGAVFFPNEFCRQTHVVRRAGETMGEHRTRMAFAAANHYYEHLGGQKPVVVVTEDEAAVRRLRSKRLEVFVVTLGEYLDKFWPKSERLGLLYGDISKALAAGGEKGDRANFTDYLRLDLLEAGMRKGRLVQGRLEVNKHHSMKEAFVVRQGGEKKGLGNGNGDILVPGLAMRNRAVHGDVVVVQLLPKSEWKSRLNRLTEKNEEEDGEDKDDGKWERRADVSPTGKVVGVLQRNWREYVATMPGGEAGSGGGPEAAPEEQQYKASRRVLAVPYDRRIPKVRVLTSQAARLAGQRIVVAIDAWPVNSQYPNGHFVRALGTAGDLETEVDGILLENGISVTSFSRGVMAEMPSGEDWRPDEEEVGRRKDFRKSHQVMSIDPIGCEDVDDALSVRRLRNGNLELGVHIADVAYFVPAGSLADQEARARATTVYLADRRYDMLPAVLSSNVCSLLGGVDRYAVSVLWELHPSTFEVLGVWYGRSVVRSSYKLSYEAAQEVIEGKKSLEEMREAVAELKAFSGQGLQKKVRQLRETLVMLRRIAQKVQDDREKEGALRLESNSEVRFEFESVSSDPSEMRPKEHLKIHETVAECMIMANHWVARKICKSFPERALLRRHVQPGRDAFDELRTAAASRGWSVDVWSNRALAESLDRCVDPGDPCVNFMLRGLATHAMVQALYFSTGSEEDWAHYGLALDRYTHFTSPIRRYADLVVHRQLLAALQSAATPPDWWYDDDEDEDKDGAAGKKGGRAGPAELPTNAQLGELSAHINERNRAAQRAQRSSQALFQALFFRGKPPDDSRCICDAVVSAVRSNGLLVYVPRYALKGPVYLQQQQQQQQQQQEGEGGKKKVLWYRKGHGPVWREGRVVVAPDAGELRVECAGQMQVYRLFDHLTVAVQLRSSGCHADSLAFHFLSNRPHRNDDSGGGGGGLNKGEVDFLKEIREEMAAAAERDQGSGGEVCQEEEGGGGGKAPQEERSKLYAFFRQMKTAGISSPEM